MNCTKILSLVFLAVLAGVNLCHAQQGVTEGLNSCLKSDSDRNVKEYSNCLLVQVKKMQPMFATGVPALGIPSLDPLVLDNIGLKKVEPPLAIDAAFSNIRVTGLQNMDIKYLNVDIFKPEKSMGLGLVVPAMIMRGQYKLGGNAFLLPIEGEGNFIAKLDTVIVEGSANIIPTGRGIKTTTDNIKVGFKVKDMAMKMDNLFGGNKVLSDTVHHFMSENSQLILEELRPELTQTLTSLITTLFTAIFDSAPSEIHRHSSPTMGLDSIIRAANTGTPRPTRNTARRS